MQLDLIFKDIADVWVRENFSRIYRYLKDQIILDGNWKFYELEFEEAIDHFKYKHGLTFTPKDIIVLAVEGDRNLYFNYELFDQTYIDITAYGACRVRFLVGAYKEKIRGITNTDFTDVPIGLSPSLPPTPSAAKLIETFNTDVGTAVGDLVVVSGFNTVTKILDNTEVTMPNGIFGVGINKPTSTTIEVLFTGIVGGYAGFTAGLPLFVSTSGVPTHTAPTTGMSQQIGFAVGSNSFFLHMLQPLRRS